MAARRSEALTILLVLVVMVLAAFTYIHSRDATMLFLGVAVSFLAG